MCGVRSDKHLVTNNNFAGNDYASFPSFFGRVEAHNPSLNTVSICHDLALELEVVNQLSNGDPHVIFAHFDDIDGAGHGNGFAADVPQYVSTIETTDAHVAQIITG